MAAATSPNKSQRCILTEYFNNYLENQNELRAERPKINADIVRFVKSKRMAWLDHVMRMEGKRIPKRVLEWKPTGKRNRGRPRKRWIDESKKIHR